ncbi:MAG: phage tail protein [Ectothiorhodospiraceae bacterium]|nr:phage tail protein [Ectothiorhodospiraceae bacterium]
MERDSVHPDTRGAERVCRTFRRHEEVNIMTPHNRNVSECRSGMGESLPGPAALARYFLLVLIALFLAGGKVAADGGPAAGYRFALTLNSLAGPVWFQEVSGLETEYRQGNQSASSTARMPGISTTDVTLRKGAFANDNNFWKWYGAIRMNTVKRETVTIQLLDGNAVPTMTWTLFNAWPTGIEGVDLKTQNDAVLVESLAFAYESLVVVQNPDVTTVQGHAVNGPLHGAVVDVLDAQGRHLATGSTDADGRFSIWAKAAPPFRLHVSGGTLDGVPYRGVLEAWCERAECHATPWSTIIVRLIDAHGFNAGDAAAALANAAGFDHDPFMHELLTGQPLPASVFDLNAVRAALDHGAGLAAWVDGFVAWLGDDVCRMPANLGLPLPSDCGNLPPPEEDRAGSPAPDCDVSPEVAAIAEAIHRYLLARPHALETIEGVAKWWLLRQRYDDDMELLRQALDYLVQKGCVVTVMLGGRIFYRAGSCDGTGCA